MSRASTGNSFFYTGVKAGGGRTFGLRSARSRGALTEVLRKDRILLLSARQLPAWAGTLGASSSGERTLRLADHAVLNDQLASLLSRGVPLTEALDVAAQTVSPGVRTRVERIRDLVASGSTFADACRTAGGFDAVTVSVYRAAERTGDLAGAAKQLASTARRTLQVAGRATTLMIYPAIVISVSLLIAGVMIVGIVPQMGRTLLEQGMDLPIMTKVLVSVGTFLREHLLWVVGLIAAGAVAVVLFRGVLMAAGAKASRTLPLIREVVLAQESARFFSVMAAMSRSGVPIADALTTANQAITHPALRTQMERLRQKLVEGGVLRMLIDEVLSLPLATRRLLIAAERAGDLESAFTTLAGDMTEEVERRSGRLIAVMQPAVIIIMFLIIGSLLAAIMIPMLTLSSRVGA
ncbi:MAG: type II secretion system F family protein [Phycisphaerales bacterium]